MIFFQNGDLSEHASRIVVNLQRIYNKVKEECCSATAFNVLAQLHVFTGACPADGIDSNLEGYYKQIICVSFAALYFGAGQFSLSGNFSSSPALLLHCVNVCSHLGRGEIAAV